jgi:hypothetical protein
MELCMTHHIRSSSLALIFGLVGLTNMAMHRMRTSRAWSSAVAAVVLGLSAAVATSAGAEPAAAEGKAGSMAAAPPSEAAAVSAKLQAYLFDAALRARSPC